MKKRKRKKITKNLIFLGIVLLLYIILGFINASKIEKSLAISKNILFLVLPIFLIVIVFMTLINLVPNKIIKKYDIKLFFLKTFHIFIFIFPFLKFSAVYKNTYTADICKDLSNIIS